MVDTATFKRSADRFVKPAPGEHRHYFNGANLLLYSMTANAAQRSGDEDLAANAREKYAMAVARLKAAAELEVSGEYANGRLAEIHVRVKNVRAGHNLPTSLTNIREMWLEVTATDGQGKTIMSTGTVDDRGKIADGARIFNTLGQDKNFEFSIHPWEIETFSKKETIPPRGSRNVVYGINLEEKGPVTIHARLQFRQASQAVAEKLYKLFPDPALAEKTYGVKQLPMIPVVEMTSTTVVLKDQI
jgi:hypothetical protein